MTFRGTRLSQYLAKVPTHPDNVLRPPTQNWHASAVQEETLGGTPGISAQGNDRARGSAAGPVRSHSPSTGTPAAPEEGDGAPGDGHGAAPKCQRLEASPGGRSPDPARVRGRREGCTAFTSSDSKPTGSAWAEPVGLGTAGGCECTSCGPLGGRELRTHRSKPCKRGGSAKGGEARGQGVARSAGQEDVRTKLFHPQASRQEAR